MKPWALIVCVCVLTSFPFWETLSAKSVVRLAVMPPLILHSLSGLLVALFRLLARLTT